MSYEDIHTALRSWQHGSKRLVLAGGEPTIRHDFMKILGLIRENNIDAELETNARMFSYERFSGRVCSVIRNFTVRLSGPDARLNDTITGVNGSFEQAIKGIKNILRYRGGIAVRIVINEMNYQGIDRLLSLIKGMGISKVKRLKRKPS